MSKKSYKSSNIRGKLRVCNYLRAVKKLKPFVPRTVAFTKANLDMMMAKYKTVYVKPDIGSLGIGIFKLKRLESGFDLKEIVKRKQLSHHYQHLSAAYARMVKSSNGKLIIQQGIKLDKVNNRSYDIRAMVQRKPRGSWSCNGFLVKVGNSGKIVTNFYQGGKIQSIRWLCKQQKLTNEQSEQRIGKLTTAALDISSALSKRKAGMHELGIDFALDQSGRLWVLEVNSNHPQFHPLKQIDRQAYNKMKHYAATYGRYSAK